MEESAKYALISESGIRAYIKLAAFLVVLYNKIDMSFPFFLATKYLKPDRSCSSAVTAIAVLGVVLGVAIVIIVRAVMTGFGDMWREKILAFKPHIVVTDSYGVIKDDVTLAASLRAVPGVEAASPSVEMRVLAEHEGHVLAPIVIGTAIDGLASLHPRLAESVIEGNLNLGDEGALVGSDLARTLNVDVGDSILIYSPANLISEDEMFFPEEVVVTGIYRMGQAEFDGNYIITSIGFARDLVGLARGGAYSIHLKTDNPQDVAAFARICKSIDSILPRTCYYRTWQEIDQALFSAIAVEKNMMVILLMFITVVAIFCVTNTIIVITVRKTSEIGLLKALGFSSRQVMASFVLYGWIQCFVGTFLGIGLAYLILHNLQGIVDFIALFGVDVFPKNVYGLDQIPWRIIPSEVIETALFVIISCTAASFIPAWRAAARNPVEALRS